MNWFRPRTRVHYDRSVRRSGQFTGIWRQASQARFRLETAFEELRVSPREEIPKGTQRYLWPGTDREGFRGNNAGVWSAPKTRPPDGSPAVDKWD